jgi:hypothetical protein
MRGRSALERRRHRVYWSVVHSVMARRRIRPTLTVTIDPGINARLRALVDSLPGATLATLMDELLGAVLPLYEDMAESFREAKRSDGSIDEAKAQELVSAAIGGRILRATGMPLPEDLEAEREARLDAAFRGERPYRKTPVQDTRRRGDKTR